MDAIVSWFTDALTGLGTGARTAGLFLAGVLDSSLVSLPEINDALIFYLSTLSPAQAPYYVLASTLGSVGGCLLLNRLASWKGTEYIQKVFPGARCHTGMRLYRRYGAWTLFVPALMPPPCPFKIFVLSSGAFGLPLRRFLLAVVVGRSLRYSIGAVLAIRYGQEALALLRAHGPYILIIVAAAALLVIALALIRLARKAHPVEDATALAVAEPERI